MVPQASARLVEEAICKILLESASVTMVELVETSDEGDAIATFTFLTFPSAALNTLPADHPKNATELKLDKSPCVVKINVKRRECIEGKLGSKLLQVEDPHSQQSIQTTPQT
jgi:hypothetical protein